MTFAYGIKIIISRELKKTLYHYKDIFCYKQPNTSEYDQESSSDDAIEQFFVDDNVRKTGNGGHVRI